MKAYLHIPFLSRMNSGRKIQSIPLSGGICFSWYDYEFSVCDDGSHLPRGEKKGKHLFTISIGIFYWSAALVIYKPINN